MLVLYHYYCVIIWLEAQRFKYFFSHTYLSAQCFDPLDLVSLSFQQWRSVYPADGTLLMNIDEENIASVLNITTPLHVRAFLSSLSLAKSLGVKPPQNLWDFKVKFENSRLAPVLFYVDFVREETGDILMILQNVLPWKILRV